MKQSPTREETIHRLSDAFRDLGYDGASLTHLCEYTGLGKSSLYHYFPGGKEEMGRAVLHGALEWLREVLERSVSETGTTEERLRQLLRDFSDFYLGGRQLCVVAVMTASSGRTIYGTELSETIRFWVECLARLVAEAGISGRVARSRAEDAVAGIQGSLIVSGALREPGPFQRLLRRLPGELLSSE